MSKKVTETAPKGAKETPATGTLYAYPESLPTHAFAVLVDAVRGTMPPEGTTHVVHAAWEVLGFGLSMGLPDHPIILGGPPVSDMEAGHILTAASKESDPKSGAIPWAVILQIAFELLQRFFNQNDPVKRAKP